MNAAAAPAPAPVSGSAPEPSGLEALLLRIGRWGVAALLVVCVLLALIVPFHATDSLVFGTWSRAIAVEHGWFFDALVGYPPYSRPLFYAPQGWIWAVVGSHEWIGRLLSLAFFVLLLWCVTKLARGQRLAPGAPIVACLLLIACPDVVQQAFAGQTDVPVAALIALVAVGLWCRAPGAAAALLIGVASCAAVLAKPTALPALGGLALAHLLGPLPGLRGRALLGVVPMAVGTVVALIYDKVTAAHFDLALNSFLGGTTASGDDNAVSRVGDAVTSFSESNGRIALILRAEWLGPYLRIVVLFALIYAALRIVRLAHRPAALAAVAAAVFWYWLGPSILPGGLAPMSTAAGARIASILFIVPLAAVAWCPAEWVPERLWLGRLLLWGVPPLLAWGLFGILGDTRTLSPAWPALFLLMATVVACGLSGLRVRGPALAAAGVALLLVVAVADLRNLDALGARPDGTINSVRALRDLTPSTWFDADKARIAADPQLGGLVDAVRQAQRPGERVVTNDGRLPFYFLTDAAVIAPVPTCEQLREYRVLALLTNVLGADEAAQLARLRRCPGVRLTPVAATPGSYAVFRVTPA